VDIEDVVSAHLCALDRARALGFGRYIISATTPFERGDAEDLRRDAPAVLRRRVSGWEEIYARLGWRMAPSIDRVYDNARARADLGWTPRYDFASVLAHANEGREIQSPLASAIGRKGYHVDAGSVVHTTSS
jgi:UDP-glucose 4-epimerase